MTKYTEENSFNFDHAFDEESNNQEVIFYKKRCIRRLFSQWFKHFSTNLKLPFSLMAKQVPVKLTQ